MRPTNKSDKTRFPRKKFEHVRNADVLRIAVRIMLFPTTASSKDTAFIRIVNTVVIYNVRELASNRITSRKKQVDFPAGIVPFDVFIIRMNNTSIWLTKTFQNLALIFLFSLSRRMLACSHNIIRYICYPIGKRVTDAFMLKAPESDISSLSVLITNHIQTTTRLRSFN